LRASSRAAEPPAYFAAFAGYGFIMALLFIYVIADEVVSVMQSFGILLNVSEATIGLTVLGIGNGVCDLIANYLVADRGFPTIATSAVYGGPVLNTYVGLGLASLIGILMHKEDLPVAAFPSLYVAIGTVMVALLSALITLVVYGRMTTFLGYVLVLLYCGFLVSTVLYDFVGA